MTSGPQDFWTLVDEIDDKVNKIIDDLIEKGKWVASKLNEAADGVLATLGHLIPGESDVEKAIKKWNDEILPALNDAISKIAAEVSKALSKLAGNPVALIQYSDMFLTVKATIYTSNTLDQDITNLGNTWSGPAYNSYQTAATGQSDALLALANSLQEGGDLTRDGADRILQLWLDLYTHFYTFQADALSVVGSLADVGKLLGAEIAPILDAIALIWSKVNDVAVNLGTFFKDQATSASGGWTKLDAGSDGLPQNQWPMVSESTSDTMNDPTNWPASA